MAVEIPGLPSLPGLPNIPWIPQFPSLPDFPLPQIPQLPQLPPIPGLPDFSNTAPLLVGTGVEETYTEGDTAAIALFAGVTADLKANSLPEFFSGISIDINGAAAGEKLVVKTTTGTKEIALEKVDGETAIQLEGFGTEKYTIVETETGLRLTFSGLSMSSNEMKALVESLAYLGNSADENPTGSRTVTISSISDFHVFGSKTTSLNLTSTIDMEAVNDAPVLTPAGVPLAEISEDDVDNAGYTVASILGDRVNDVDGNGEGIAVVGLVGDNGVWQYKIGDGSWTAFGETSASSALLLGNADMVRFQPDGKNGTSASITYHAWDQSNGATAGDVVVISETGGSSAYSSLGDTTPLNVRSVNDSPISTDIANASVTAGSVFSFEPDDSFSDVDEGATLTYTVKDGNGADIPWLTFNPATRAFSGTPTTAGTYTVVVTASDGVEGSTNAVESFTLTVAPVSGGGGGGGSTNAAPVVSLENVDQTVQGGRTFSLVVGDGHFTDPDADTDLDYTIEFVGQQGLPSGLSFDAETGTLSGAASNGGIYTVRVTASDGSLEATDEFQLNITAPTQIPVGTRGRDKIVGDDLDNVIDGRKGNDKLTGGDGADTFIFGKKYGRDVITDFDPSEGDKIDLSDAAGIKGFRDLINHHAVEVGDNVKITTDDGSVLIIKNFDLDDLSRDMFIF